MHDLVLFPLLLPTRRPVVLASTRLPINAEGARVRSLSARVLSNPNSWFFVAALLPPPSPFRFGARIRFRFGWVLERRAHGTDATPQGVKVCSTGMCVGVGVSGCKQQYDSFLTVLSRRQQQH